MPSQGEKPNDFNGLAIVLDNPKDSCIMGTRSADKLLVITLNKGLAKWLNQRKNITL